MARTIDWSYHRPSWKTCGKTQEFLADHGIEIKEQINARKVAVPESELPDLLDQVDTVHASVGRRVVSFDLRNPGERHEVEAAVCRNGKLRAPALRMGRTLIVGFDEGVYETVLGLP